MEISLTHLRLNVPVLARVITYSNIIVYQKYIGTSIKVGCATRSLHASPGPKAEGVRGDGDQDPVASADI